MMKPPQISTKRVAISKANAQMVIIVGVASALAVFCLVASHAVFSQNTYRARVISAKSVAKKQLQANIKTFSQLQTSYKKFDDAPVNKLGGNSADLNAENGGSNSKLILDSLPSTYDFPALASSLEKILVDSKLKVGGITGTDDQLAQQANVSSISPKPVAMPFSFSIAEADYNSVQALITKLQSSIRPIQIDSMSLNGSADKMQVQISAHTYYQPGKSVNITQKAVK